MTPSTTHTQPRLKSRQPRSFDRFQCAGADCEDTCCVGWGVPVDRATYEKYQGTADRKVNGHALSDLVELNPASPSPADYGRMRLQDAACPALEDKLCGIQKSLGEAYLPDLCSKYPRVYNAFGETVERSLHLSCPVAARLVLTEPDAMEFEERREEHWPHRPGSLNYEVEDPEDGLYRARLLLIELIKDRSVAMWQRLGAVGAAVERLSGIAPVDAVEVLEAYLRDFRLGRFRDELSAPQPDSVFQLETVLEIVVARISGDYTPRGFLDCYRDFMLGLQWTPDATMEDLAGRYDFACQRYFLPFADRHPHFFENYLTNFIFRSVFPYRSKLAGRKFAIDSSRESLRHSFVLLALHYAIVRTLLIGVSALYRDDLNPGIAVRLAQTYSRAFLHSTSFEAKAFEYLERTLPDPAARIAQLVMERAPALGAAK